jgi:excisionase family DNA binding protein
MVDRTGRLVDEAADRLLTRDEAASRLRVSSRTVRRLEKSELSSTRVGNQVRIPEAVLVEYLKSNTREPG